MKTFLYPLLLFFFSFHLSIGQAPIEYIISEYWFSEMHHIIHAAGKTFVAGHIRDCDQAAIFAFDENGNKEWVFITDGFSQVRDMIFRASDSTLFIANDWRTADDVGSEFDGPNIFALNINGDTLFETHLSIMEFGNNLWGSPSFDLNSNNELVVAVRNSIFWLDDTGNVLSDKEFPDSLDYRFNNMTLYDDTTMFVSNNEKAFILNEVGEIQLELDFSNYVLDIEIDGENILFLTEAELFIYHIPTSALSSNNTFTNTLETAEGISLDNNWVYVWGKDNSESSIIGQIEKNNYTLVQSVPNEQGIITDIFSDGNTLYFTGIKDTREGIFSSIFEEALFQPFVKTTPIFTEPIYIGPNISIQNFEVLVPAEIDYFDSIELFYHYVNPSVIFEYEVTNESLDTIFSYSISGQHWFGSNCSRARYFSHEENIVIPPGETLLKQDSFSTFWTQYQEELELTIFAPNHRFDSDISNNYLLGENLVGIENTFNQPNFKLNFFPNPTNHNLNISFETENLSTQEKFRIINLDGKILEEMEINFSPYYKTIDVEKYTQGIYFFQYLKNGAVVNSKKIIVQK